MAFLLPGRWVRLFLPGRHPSHYLFSPRDAMAHFRQEQRKNRKTKVQPSQVRRKKRNPRRPPGKRYTTDSYAVAMERACVRADAKAHRDNPEIAAEVVLVPHWHPNQMRHAAGMAVRRQFGLEAAEVVLGHSRADVTQVYAERDEARAIEVAREIG